MIRLWDFLPSGNCYKVRLLLTQLGIPFERVDVPLPMSGSHAAEYRQLNPIGRVPMVELEPGRRLAESNAILWYFGEGTRFIPDDKYQRAQMLQWMFFEQYSHEPYIAVLRAWLKYFGVPSGREHELDERKRRGVMALDVMEDHLRSHPFFAGSQYSLADIALYAYTHVAGEGGFTLDGYPEIRRWLARVAEQPGHIPITQA